MLSLTIGINSWVTIIEADDYFNTRHGSAAWLSLDQDTEKIPLLVTAYNWIQQQQMFNINPAAKTNKVKNAQCEAAWYIYKFWIDHEKRRALYIQGVSKFKIGSFSEDLHGAEFPAFISNMLGDYLTSLGGTFPKIERDYN